MTPAGALGGKVALVTGAGSLGGIGAAIARALAADGATVVATDIDAAGARGVAGATGGRVEAMALDVTDRRAIESAVADVAERHGGLDILVNNAGTTAGAKPFLEVTAEDWRASIDVNLLGTADLCQAAIPALLERGGVIVNISSMTGIGGQRAFGAYTATKHALIGLTKTIAAEFGDRGLRCNAVCPGYIGTELHHGVTRRLAQEAGIGFEEMQARRYATVAMKRAGGTDEVAGVVAFLCGPGAAYITGAAIPVTGGVQLGL
jgi:NAD(P)-dependent dehydrogenase (short-subunit alcohol dehydrogenase family)